MFLHQVITRFSLYASVLFEKKINTDSRSTIMPKLSSWMLELISTSSVNACSYNNGDIYVIGTVELFSNWSQFNVLIHTTVFLDYKLGGVLSQLLSYGFLRVYHSVLK